MWQEEGAGKLREEIEALLEPLSNLPNFYTLVREPMARVGEDLAAGDALNRLWPLLSMIVCESISGQYEPALPVAAAIQFFKAAGEVFDDIEDADSSESMTAKYGSAVATNVATALLFLAEKALARLKRRGIADCVIVQAMDVVNSFYTTACGGQHLDLSGGFDRPFSEDNYLKVAHMKSATTSECACHLGALLATTSQEMIDTFTEFGYNIGLASQIANDIQGITQGRDILKRKATLPVIYALSQADEYTRRKLESAFDKTCDSPPDLVKIRDLLFQTGAIHYATIKMEYYKQFACDSLLEAEKAGACVERLKLFLEQTR